MLRLARGGQLGLIVQYPGLLHLEELPTNPQEGPLVTRVLRPVKIERVQAEEKVILVFDCALREQLSYTPTEPTAKRAEDGTASGTPDVGDDIGGALADEVGEVVYVRVEEGKGAQNSD